jgi:hypothetical protein
VNCRDLLIAAFVASRIVIGFIADHPEVYPSGSADATSDVVIFEATAERVLGGDRPYRDFHGGYPPGSLPVMIGPALVGSLDYRTAFVVGSIALDALGLWAVWRIARRHESSMWAAVAWLVLLPLLGPVAYTRLDMAVAATLAWACERIDSRDSLRTGILLGLGAAIKVTPALLLPAAVAAATNRRRMVVGALALGALFALPFAWDLPEMYDDVLGGNVERGVHAESLWGSLALLAEVMSVAEVEVVSAFNASDIVASFTSTLKVAADLTAGAVLVASVALVRRAGRRDGAAHSILTLTATLTLLIAVGRVLSPQYLVWLVPLYASSAAVAGREIARSGILFAVAAGLTQLLYPVLHWDYLAIDSRAVALTVLRNLLLLAAGTLAVRAVWLDRDRTEAAVGETTVAAAQRSAS